MPIRKHHVEVPDVLHSPVVATLEAVSLESGHDYAGRFVLLWPET
ncbi:MAG TPA: hypothetical protein VIO37_10160 [Candidatus Dormibacteraeota bacterium]